VGKMSTVGEDTAMEMFPAENNTEVFVIFDLDNLR
jgi:hypothetical protein